MDMVDQNIMKNTPNKITNNDWNFDDDNEQDDSQVLQMGAHLGDQIGLSQNQLDKQSQSKKKDLSSIKEEANDDSTFKFGKS